MGWAACCALSSAYLGPPTPLYHAAMLPGWLPPRPRTKERQSYTDSYTCTCPQSSICIPPLPRERGIHGRTSPPKLEARYHLIRCPETREPRRQPRRPGSRATDGPLPPALVLMTFLFFWGLPVTRLSHLRTGSWVTGLDWAGLVLL